MYRYLIGAAAVAALVIAIFTTGYVKGKANVQAKWDIAEARQLARGVDAQTDAEAAIPPVAEGDGSPYAPGLPCRLPDRYDRDCH